MKNFWRIITGIFEELSDQRAYRLHLEQHGAEHSAAEWRRFCDERWTERSHRGRVCC